MNPIYTLKILRGIIWQIILVIVSAPYNEGMCQIVTHKINTPISATVSGQNTSANFQTKYVLCNASGIINYSIAILPFANVAVGNYNMFAVNFDGSQTTPNLSVGTNISSIGGSCVSVSSPLNIGVSDCNNITGNIIFTNSTFNSTTGFTQKYILTDAKQKILLISDSTKFLGLTNGVYNVYALNYQTSNGITNLALGNSISSITGICFNLSNPIGYVVCIPTAPTIVTSPPIFLTVPQDTTSAKQVCTTVLNPSNATLTLSSCGVPAHGTGSSSINGNQLCLTYKPNSGYSGLDTVCVKICNAGGCDSIKVLVSVTPTAIAPPVVPKLISIVISQDTTGSKQICATVSNPSNATLIPSSCGAPNHGTSTFSVIGNQLCVSYKPNIGYAGQDTICVKLCDAGGCDSVKIPVTVTPTNANCNNTTGIITFTQSGNNATGMFAQRYALTDSLGKILQIAAAKNFTVAQSGLYKVYAVNYDSTQSISGLTVNQNISQVSGVCLNTSGALLFRVCLTAPPVITKPVTITVPQDTTGSKKVCTTVSNPDNASLTLSSCGAPAHGSSTSSITGNQFCLTYKPTTGYSGPDTVCVKVCDAGGCDSVKVPVTVTPTAIVKPAISNPVSVTVPQDTSGSKQVCTTVTNPSNAALTPSLCNTPVSGTITVTVNGNQVCLTYKPNIGFVGKDTACVKVCNTGGCDSLKIPIAVTPTTANCNNTTGLISFTQAGNNTTGSFAQRYVLTDSAGKILQVSTTKSFTIAQNALYRVYAFNYDSTTVSPQPSAVSLQGKQIAQSESLITGCLNITGGLVYRVCIPVAPSIVVSPPLSITVPQDTMGSKQICTTVTNLSNSPLTPTLCSAPLHGTSTVSVTGNTLCVTYKPTAGYSGPDTICAKVCSVEGCDSTKIPVTVVPTAIVAPVITKPISTIIIPQDTTGSKQVCTTISNPSNATLTPSSCGAPNHGTSTVSITSNQLCVSYKPNAAYSGVDTVCVKVCDAGGCDSVKVPVSVTPTPIVPPVIPKLIAIVTPQDTTGAKQVCTTISNPSNATLTPSSCGSPNHGTATVSLTGNQLCVSYKPNTGYAGQDTICVKVCDAGGCDSVKIPVTITPSNANCNNTTGIITFTQVGNNATGVFTQRYTLTDSVGKILQIASSKNFTVAQSGLYKVYAVNYDSTQSVTNLSVNQNIASVVGVCLNISSSLLFRVCLPAPPVITKPVTITVPQDTSAAKTVCTSVLNPNNATLTLSSCGAPSNGAASVSLVGNQLCVSYKPNTGYSGQDTVCVKLCDTGGCDSIKIPVTVTPTPIVPPVIIKPITSIIIPQDTTGSKQVCTTVTNPSNAALTPSFCSAAVHGTSTFSLVGNQLCVSYKPIAGYSGPDTVCVKVCDVAGCDSIKVPITVTPGAILAPVITKPLTIVVPQDTTGSKQVCTTITYNNTVPTTLSSCGSPNYGKASANVIGNQLCISYKPNAGYYGADTICLKVCNLVGCDSIKVPVVATPVNVNCNNWTGIITFTQTGNNTTGSFTQRYVLTDSLDKILQISTAKTFTVQQSALYKVYAVNYDSSAISSQQSAISSQQTALIGKLISDSPTLTATFGACLNISPAILYRICLPLPVINKPLSIVVPQDTSGFKKVCTTVLNTNYLAVTLSSCGNPLHGASTITIDSNSLCVAYKPVAGYSGPDTVCVRVCNIAGCDSIKVPVTVTPLAIVPPVITKPVTIVVPQDTTGSKQVCTTVSNPSNAPLSLSSCGAPNHGTSTVSITGNQLCITYKPNAGYSGLDSVCVKVCDAAGCDSIKVPVTVTPTPIAPPVITKTVSITTLQDTTGSKQVCTTVSNPSNSPLTASSCGAPNHGTSTVSLTGNQLCITYKPTAGYSGPDTVCVKICNAGGCDSIKLPVIVTPTINCNNATGVITFTQTGNNTSGVYAQRYVLTDSSGKILQISTAKQFNVNSGLYYVYAVNYDSTKTVSGLVVGQNVSAATGTCYNLSSGLPFRVCLPIAPTIVVSPPVKITVPQDTTGAKQVCTTVTNPSNATLIPSSCGAPLHGTATASITGNTLCVTYKPTAGYNGLDTVCVKVCDAGGCDSIKVPVIVTPLPPVIPKTPPVVITVPQDTTSPKTVCVTVSNPSNIPLTPSSCGAPNHGTSSVTLTSNQLCVSYKPTPGYSGLDTICVKVCDAAGCDSIKIPVIVTPTPIAPPVITKPVTITTPQDTTGSKQVCTTVLNPSNAVLTPSSCGAPNHGTSTATLTGNNLCISYKPNAGYSGPDTICLKVCNAGGCDSIKVPVIVTPYVNCNNSTGVITFTQTGNNVSGVYAQRYILTDSLGKILQIGTTKMFTVTQSALYNVYALNYDSTKNISGLTVNQNITNITSSCLNITAPLVYRVCLPAPPVITKPVTIIIPQDTTGSKTVCTPISNPDNAPLALSICGAAQHGIANLNVSNNQLCITYKPTAGYSGKDSICIKVCDVSGCDSIVVPITVTPLPPVIPKTPPPTITVPQDTTSPKTVCVTVTNPSNATLTTSSCGAPLHGTSTLTVTGNQLCVSYKPTAGYNGPDSICVKVCNTGGCDSIKVPVTVTKIEICGDGLDNDGNGLIDCEDPACVPCNCDGTSPTINFTSPSPSPGLGFTQKYALTTTGNKILQISLTKNFVSVLSGQYRIYAVTYNTLQGVQNFAVNNLIDSVKGTNVTVSKPTLFRNCVINYCAKLTLKVFMEGPMDSIGDTMRTTLNKRGLLPGQTPVGYFGVKTPNGHPYTDKPWKYSGNESMATQYDPSVVDWVLVSIRKDSLSKSSNAQSRAGLLHKDGTVEFLDSCWTLTPTQRYYVVVEHRNHVGVMYNAGFTAIGGDLFADFTTADSYKLTNPGTFGQKLSHGKYMMFATDGQKQNSDADDDDVNSSDSQLWKTQSGTFDHYLPGDYNMDGDVNFLDIYLWKKNNGYYSGIPK